LDSIAEIGCHEVWRDTLQTLVNAGRIGDQKRPAAGGSAGGDIRIGVSDHP
jgi:hypothetical protein